MKHFIAILIAFATRSKGYQYGYKMLHISAKLIKQTEKQIVEWLKFDKMALNVIK